MGLYLTKNAQIFSISISGSAFPSCDSLFLKRKKNLCPVSVCTLNATFTISHSTHTFPPSLFCLHLNGDWMSVPRAPRCQVQRRCNGKWLACLEGQVEGWEQLRICLTAIGVVETIQNKLL